ncbi:glycine cleavage system protein GcvH [Pacificimonas flava]|nr:glycine cleavage system protein GcvH [Pacificimonas flava]
MTVRFTESHEWVRVEGDTAIVGITAYAQDQLGDVVFVELPDAGKTVKKGDEIAVVESVKAASEVYAPVAGTVTEANGALEADPSLVNSAPETGGWFLKMTLSDSAELEALMDEAAYKDFVKDL